MVLCLRYSPLISGLPIAIGWLLSLWSMLSVVLGVCEVFFWFSMAVGVVLMFGGRQEWISPPRQSLNKLNAIVKQIIVRCLGPQRLFKEWPLMAKMTLGHFLQGHSRRTPKKVSPKKVRMPHLPFTSTEPLGAYV